MALIYGTWDIVLEPPYMNRGDPSTADMLALFAARLSVRLLLDEESIANAHSLLKGVAGEIDKAAEHYLPYQQIKSAAASREENNLMTILLIYS